MPGAGKECVDETGARVPPRYRIVLSDEKARAADTHRMVHASQQRMQPDSGCIPCALIRGYFRNSKIIGIENRSVVARAGEWE